MNLEEHAVMEIGFLGIEDKDKKEYIKAFILNFLLLFREQGHTNNTAPFVINGFKKLIKDKTFLDSKLEDIIDYDECDLAHQLVKKFHEQVNTEEFVAYEIDEEWMKRVCYRLMEWKPITPLNGTPEEWYTRDEVPYMKEDGTFQNKRYSCIFAKDDHGKDAVDIDAKVFVQNGIAYTCKDSSLPISFPYDVPDEREVITLEDYIPVEDFESIFLVVYNRYGDKIAQEFTIGYRPSTLDTHINNYKFHKANYCIMRRYIKDENPIWIVDATFEDMPIYRVRMEARFKEELKNVLKRDPKTEIYEDKELTKLTTL